jgi:small subunit ribosomal protein S9
MVDKATIKETTEKIKEEKKVEAATYYEAFGRRKEATARVRLYVVKEQSIEVLGQQVEKGAIVVNGKSAEVYFPGEVYKKIYQEPLRTTNTASRFAIVIKTVGGGLVSQLGAVVLGMSRALEKVDKEKMRPILKKKGFLTRDSRVRERRKAGMAGKARAKKQSPKR